VRGAGRSRRWPSGPLTAPGVAYGVPGCDAAQVQRSFAALSDVEMGRELVALDYAALVREGRAMQLAAQLAALTDLIEAREIDRRSEQPAGTRGGGQLGRWRWRCTRRSTGSTGSRRWSTRFMSRC
jgi:hypothetical protein